MHRSILRRGLTLAAVVALLGATAVLGIGGIGSGGDEAGASNGTFNDAFDSYPVAVNGDYQPLVGDFDCAGGAREILWYAPGPAPDYLWDITGTAGGQLQYTSTRLEINGTYEPFLIPFNEAGGCDSDIFWYAPGRAPDYIWDVDLPGSFDHTSVRTTVNGDYTPIFTGVGGAGGIFWYAPGSATDSMWSLDRLGGITKGTGPQVSGVYRPVRGDATLSTNYGILWYARGPSQDHYWDGLTLGNSRPGRDIPVTINGYYEPHNLDDDILLYGPGTAPDYLITQIDGTTGAITTLPGSVSGTYRVATPDSGIRTIVWHAPGGARDYIWLDPGGGILGDGDS